MRLILIASAIIAASVSTASAQQSAPTTAAQQAAPTAPAASTPPPVQPWSMDHGRSEDAANAAKVAAAAAAAKAAATAASPSPAQSANFVVNGSATIAAEPPRTPEQQKDDAQAQAAWQARCRPAVVEDRDGLRRIKYAEGDCDLSRYNTAGR